MNSMRYLGESEGRYSYVFRRGFILQVFPRAGSTSVANAIRSCGLEYAQVGLTAAKAFREWFDWPVYIVMRDPNKRARSCYQHLAESIGDHFFDLHVFEAEVSRANDHACPVSWWWGDSVSRVFDLESPKLLELLEIESLPHDHPSGPMARQFPLTVLNLYTKDAKLYERAE